MMDELDDAIDGMAGEMKALLQRAIGFQSVSGQEGAFTRFLGEWGEKRGFDVDLWQAKEEDLGPAGSVPRHIPLAGRPTLVIRKPGRNPRLRSLVLNAHADVVGVPEPGKWVADPWSGKEVDGRFYGRGACDVKGGLVSALWAMSALSTKPPNEFGGEIFIEIIPGEEDCVGLGTLTSIARGYAADGVVVLEPTEGLPRNASRPGLRFEIVALGRAVHGTVKWLGEDSIILMRKILNSLELMENQWNSETRLGAFADYPILRPISVDQVNGGQWQGMVCDRCMCGGYLELLPGDEGNAWRKRFRDDLSRSLRGMGVVNLDGIEINFPEQYDGHHTMPDSPICRVAEQTVLAMEGSRSSWQGWRGFNSGCEAGVRWKLTGAPTLVWGPGSLAQAHAVDEFIEFGDVQRTARLLARFAARWCSVVKDA